LINLQIVKGRFLEEMALEQQLADTKLNAKRGVIYDRNMNPLAQSATVWTLALEPAYITGDERRELICNGLHKILGIEKEKLMILAKKKSFYTIVKKKIENDCKDQIVNFKKENKITSGIRLIEDYKRYYPLGRFAATLLGFTGDDSQGLAGIEAYYDKTLKGETGKIINAKNAIGTDMPFDYEQMIPAKDGYSLRLCIDSAIQKIVEKYLSEGIIVNKVQNRGVAIAMDVTNGEILALAVKEDFDPNDPFKIVSESDALLLDSVPEEEKSKVRSEILAKQWRNKAVSDTYYPGSVFKMVVASIGLELGIIDENSPFHCSGGIKISERSQYIRCWKRGGHGAQTFREALCHSCNPAFISLGQRIGISNFFNYYKSFGFHERSGIDLPGETRDLFFSNDGKMAPIDLAVASVGQNFGITPIQMITAASAIANGGKLVRPHVVKEIIDSNGNIIKTFNNEVRRTVISENVSKRVCAMMAENAIWGGARNAYVPGFRIAGKTGTSEKIGLSTPGYKDYISSFCGFAPADDPKIALLIFLDTPRGDYYYGSIVAAPIFSSIVREVLPYLKVETKYTQEEMEKFGTKAPELIGKKTNSARNLAINAGLKPTVLGNGGDVVSQMPLPGEQIPKGGTILIYTENLQVEKVKVPNFIGLEIEKAKELAAYSRLNLVSLHTKNEKGRLTAVSQSLEAGAMVNVGSVIEIKFINKEKPEE
jgi:stage V sporulation protein D (sporulation-specific penicillin-binding protein)